MAGAMALCPGVCDICILRKNEKDLFWQVLASHVASGCTSSSSSEKHYTTLVVITVTNTYTGKLKYVIGTSIVHGMIIV